MFNTYARVFNDESDGEDAALSRLIREAAGGPPQPPNVVTSTGVSRVSQQNVQQRRGGGRVESISTTIASTSSAPAAASSPNVANLIDFGDEPELRTTAASTAPPSRQAGKVAVKQRGRGKQPASQQQVELVTFAQSDPFDILSQSSASLPIPQQPRERKGHHPLDLLLDQDGPSDLGRDGSTQTGPQPLRSETKPPSSSAAAFASFGSFSDLLRPLASLGAVSTTTPPAAGVAAAAAPSSASVLAGSGPSPSGGSMAWGSFRGAPPDPHSMLRGHPHSQSTNGIDDLLMEQRLRREVDTVAGGIGPAAGPGPRSLYFSDDPFDLVGHPAAAGASHSASAAVTGAAGRGSFADVAAGGGGKPFRSASVSAGGGDPQEQQQQNGVAGSSPAASGCGGPADQGFAIGSGGGEGHSMNHRELLLYAIPLFKDRLVFLPVVSWKEAEDTSTVLGKVNAGIAQAQLNISHMWHSLKDKGEFSAKIYKAGQAILENMNAEERLMRNIPRKANKLVVHHPAAIPPDEIQDQLTQLTSSFCYKSAGKAAAAGLMLPVAVGLEVIAVPGIGWYTAYQLFKSTSAAAGGSRLNNYLKSDKSEVRVCYSPTTKMDIYLLKSRLNPDCVLGLEDIEDLCHDIREPSLVHPLTELRNRYLRKTQTTKADYALLPMTAPDVEEQYGSGPKKKD